MSRVLAAVHEAARLTPHRIVVTSGQGSLTCVGLLTEVESLAAELAGDTSPVGVVLDNGPDWVVADLALIAAGRPSVPIPPFFTPEQRSHALADAGAGLDEVEREQGPCGGVGVVHPRRIARAADAIRPEVVLRWST